MEPNNPSRSSGAQVLDPGEPAKRMPAPMPVHVVGDVATVTPYAPPEAHSHLPPGQTYVPPGPSTVLPSSHAPVVPVARPEAAQSSATTWLIVGVVGLLVLAVGAIIVVMFTSGNIIGNIVSGQVGNLQTDSRTFSLGDAKSADINLDMNAGNIKLAGGATDLARATFTYNVDAWKPDATYNISGDTGKLNIRQPRANVISGNTHNTWDLTLKNDVPLNLTVNQTAGNVDLQLGGLALRSLNVNNTAGNTTVNLAGAWNNNVEATINGVAGNTTLRVPADVGVRVTVERGLGNIRANGLTGNGDVYTNAAYGKSTTTLNIHAGVQVGNLIIDSVK